MKKFKTEQEEFWAGEFGNNYIDRNNDSQIIAGNANLFSKILTRTNSIKSILEFGANIGLNLIALKQLLPNCIFSAVEINETACKELKKKDWINAINESILSFESKEKYDLVFSKGVLIHINPDELNVVYNKLFGLSKKYISIIEYYNPSPVEINYRGEGGKLFKRDFAGEMLKLYPTLELIDYGFSYHLDSNFPQDDLNWFLLKKSE
ncbi:MAG: pseudaminic acid biosynthesis-associated methylase [Ignavibacteriaceae bacterium]